jgi:dinuclear metal center YbgI/SA1388 family protein
MLIGEIYEYLNSVSPFELQESWDNSGLLIGNMEDEIQEVVIALDLDLQMIQNIQPNSLIITHHPLIFKGLKRFNDDSYSSKIAKYLIKNDIALISMHTNIDKTHLNRYVASEVLGLDFEQRGDFLLEAKIDMEFNKFVSLIKEKLQIDTIKVTQVHDKLSSVAICTGSGMSLLDEVKADLFLTGDIKYHDAMEAMAREISLIDIGHFESEHYFVALINDILEKYLKKNKIKAIMMDSQNPFQYI